MTKVIGQAARGARACTVACASLTLAGCGDEAPEPEAPSAEKKMLDKLDSDDPDKFLEGVDEARGKYGKKE
jgi:hypothetical protein